jgi:copper chaperone NosL
MNCFLSKWSAVTVSALVLLCGTAFGAADDSRWPPEKLGKEQQRAWQGSQQKLVAEYAGCIEHCGTEKTCLEKCAKARDARLDREYRRLIMASAGGKPVQPAATDKCPVCGMFVAPYPHWAAEIIFKDSSVAFFDGAKDLFTYYFNLKKYNPKKSAADIAAVYVTAYYTKKFIDARSALFVLGSDVNGPMGAELVPFAARAEAEEFIKDHKGKKLLSFAEVTPQHLSASP